MEVVNISKFLHMILCYTYSDLIYFIDDNFFMPHQSTISCLDLGQYLIWRLLIHLEILMGICFHQKILNLTTTWLCLFLFKELKTTCHTMACGYFIAFQGQRNVPKWFKLKLWAKKIRTEAYLLWFGHVLHFIIALPRTTERSHAYWGNFYLLFLIR